MFDVLELLLALSVIDAEIQELEVENERVPENIEELESERSRVRAKLEAVEGRSEDLGKDRTRMEHELEDLQAKLEDLSAKRLAIKTNEEYAALTHEISFVQRAIEEKERAIFGILEQQETASSELAGLRDEVSTAERDLDGRVASLREELSRLSDALTIKRDERLRVATRVDRAILGRYERILVSKGDSALANCFDGACSGCGMTLPPQTVIEIKRSDRLMECQSCGRILYWQREPESG